MNEMKVGQIFKDNDPRMTRHVLIIDVYPGEARYHPCTKDGKATSLTTATSRTDRFYFDGKPRKSGFSFVTQRD